MHSIIALLFAALAAVVAGQDATAAPMPATLVSATPSQDASSTGSLDASTPLTAGSNGHEGDDGTDKTRLGGNYANQAGKYDNKGGNYGHQDGDYGYKPDGYGTQAGNYGNQGVGYGERGAINKGAGYGHQDLGYGHQATNYGTGYGNQGAGYGDHNIGYGNQGVGYGNGGATYDNNYGDRGYGRSNVRGATGAGYDARQTYGGPSYGSARQDYGKYGRVDKDAYLRR
ncbi:hypothetical protein SDRG_12639 [Saprolegnia diclina VS20]|uniref:Uncharacterized protein n=1 Tax=Saprolegnia diclina (strain VS20) TaxID=1156394 RepID=T0Q836_SAPDV|nr:hypothetical protein SDRG_12639 [Saprolegnia diclina VS20]EQC29635.1 hypothetical protein SDRG_12639 [Saprolegnia diclina VS20]|eukprot:XP_008616939.1 hypothetical protein SDRG_12639 [Saprolegnia diclina VS20]